ncbi:MAG TPA: hypothetical protein VFG71_00205, partial [Nitrospiraceae bacterium]|nr:hypothetical protein [Nitrospiraceae bacterium]
MRWMLAQRYDSTARKPRICSAAQLVPLSFATERRTVLAVALRPRLLGKCQITLPAHRLAGVRKHD